MGLLPDQKSPPISDPSLFTYLLYGAPGIGKTTFCSKLENAVFLDTESGTKLQSVYKVPIPDWETFLKAVAELKDRSKHKFNTVVIDTVGNLLNYLIKYSCDKLGITHPSEMGYGKSYDLIKKTFLLPLSHLQFSGLGLWLVSHSQIKSIKNPLGSDFDYIEPAAQDYLKNILVAACDFIFYVSDEVYKETDATGKITGVTQRRIIHTKPSKGILAKDRNDKAPLPEKMPFDAVSFLSTLKECLKKNSEILANV